MPAPGGGSLSRLASCIDRGHRRAGVLGVTRVGIATDALATAQATEPAVAPAMVRCPLPVPAGESCEPAEQGGDAGERPEQDRDPEHEVER